VAQLPQAAHDLRTDEAATSDDDDFHDIFSLSHGDDRVGGPCAAAHRKTLPQSSFSLEFRLDVRSERAGWHVTADGARQASCGVGSVAS
jgi:hypothetical protein